MHEGSKGLDSHVLLVVDHKHLRVLGTFECRAFLLIHILMKYLIKVFFQNPLVIFKLFPKN